MGERIPIEIQGRDAFWVQAFHVEWEYQFPDRKLVEHQAGTFLVEAQWLNDLERIGAQTFCQVLRAPADPRRRRWMSSLFPERPK